MTSESPSTQIKKATSKQTQKALEKYRQLLSSRLLPDLSDSMTSYQRMVSEIQEYHRLRDALRSLDTTTTTSSPNHVVLSHLGEGVAIQAQLLSHQMPLISLGLAQFYAQLTNREARAFITKKIVLLEKKRDSQLEKVAQIEAHIHLVSTSITQLDHLYRGGSILDDVK